MLYILIKHHRTQLRPEILCVLCIFCTRGSLEGKKKLHKIALLINLNGGRQAAGKSLFVFATCVCTARGSTGVKCRNCVWLKRECKICVLILVGVETKED